MTRPTVRYMIQIVGSAAETGIAQTEVPAMINRDSRKDQVILKAAQVIHAKGFEAATVNDISKATGLTKGGLYHYIKSKRDLLYRIMTFAMDITFSEVVDKARDITDPEEQLRTVIRLHVELIIEDAGLLSALSDEVAGLEHEQAKQILQRKREYFEFFRGILVRLKRQHKLAKVDPTVATFSIFGMVLFCSKWYRPGGALKPGQLADEIANIALGGIIR